MKRVSTLFTVVTMLCILTACKRHETPAVAMPTLPVNPRTTVLATIAGDERADTNPASPHQTPDSLKDLVVIEFSRYGNACAYIARDKAGVHVTHNGKEGKSYTGIDSTSLTLSPDGKRVAYCAQQSDKWYVVVDAKEYGPFDDKGGPVFSPDSRHVAFEAKSGSTWRIASDTGMSSETELLTGKPQFSYDSSKIMYIHETKKGGYHLVIADLSFKVLADHSINNISLVEDPTLKSIFIVDKMGEKNLQIKSVSYDNPSQVMTRGIYPEVINPKVSRDGKQLSFLTRIKGDNYLVLNNTDTKIPAGGLPQSPYFLADGSIGVVVEGLNGTSPYRLFSAKKFTVPSSYKEVSDLVTTANGERHAFLAIKNEQFMIVCNGVEGPVYDRVTSPQFSPDGKYLTYRARRGDKRFVVIADAATNSVLREHPGYERVFETTFTQDGTSVAYGVKDGNMISWKVEKLP